MKFRLWLQPRVVLCSERAISAAFNEKQCAVKSAKEFVSDVQLTLATRKYETLRAALTAGKHIDADHII